MDYRVPEKVVSAGVFLAMEKKKGSLYREPKQQLLLNKHYYNGWYVVIVLIILYRVKQLL